MTCFSSAEEALPPLPAKVGMRSWLLSFFAAVKTRVSRAVVRRKVGSVCRRAGLIVAYSFENGSTEL